MRAIVSPQYNRNARILNDSRLGCLRRINRLTGVAWNEPASDRAAGVEHRLEHLYLRSHGRGGCTATWETWDASTPRQACLDFRVYAHRGWEHRPNSPDQSGFCTVRLASSGPALPADLQRRGDRLARLPTASVCAASSAAAASGSSTPPSTTCANCTGSLSTAREIKETAGRRPGRWPDPSPVAGASYRFQSLHVSQ